MQLKVWNKISITSFSQLEAEINKLIGEGLEKVGEAGVKTVKEQIQRQVYASHIPTEYERTFGLRNSVVSQTKGNTAYIFHDGMEGYFSVVKGYQAQSSLIPDLIHTGAPNIFNATKGQSPAWSKPRSYIDTSKDIVEQNAISVFKKIFS